MPLAMAGRSVTADMINRQYTQADASNTTASGTSLSALCTAYPIPAFDPGQFTCYRLTAWGTAQWGSTQHKLSLAMVLTGTAIGTQPSIAPTAFSASAVLNWRLVLELMCTSTGAAGTWSAVLAGTVSSTANPLLPGTAADNTVPVCAVTGTDVTQDTTAANSLVIQAEWDAITGTTPPAITCINTMFERLAV